MIKVLCVAPFNNPHITPIYDALADEPALEVTRVSRERLPKERASMGWPEMSSDAPYLQPWRRYGDRLSFYRHLIYSDVVILPGFFQYRSLPLHHYLRMVGARRLVFLWSEPFLEHPRTSRARYSLLLRRFLLRFADTYSHHLLTMSADAQKDYARLGISKWAVWEFAYAVDAARSWPAARRGGDNAVTFLFCGSLTERKGVDVLMRALAEPRISVKQWRLMIVGGGPLELRLKAEAKAAGIAHKVDFLGVVRHGNVRKLYEMSDVLVLPSRFDGWGAVVNEGMQHGLAIVASDRVGAATTMVRHGQEGFLTPPLDQRALSSILDRFLEDRRALVKMQAMALRKSDLYRPKVLAQRLSVLCQKLCAKSDPRVFAEGPCRFLGRVGGGGL